MKILLAVLVLSCAARARAEFLSPQFAQTLQQLRQALPRWTNVNLRVSSSGSFCDVTEPMLRINLNGSKDSFNRFNLSGWVDNQYLSVSANPNGNDPRRGYWLTGSGVSVNIDPFGSAYRVTGSVDSKFLSMTVDRFGSGYSIYGQSGANLNGNSWGHDLNVNGSVDLAQFDKKSLAVLGVALAAIDAAPAR